jgi:predicted metal-dependent peptidase
MSFDRYKQATPEEKLSQARLSFILQQSPFFGTLALHLKLVEADWLPTAGVDGKHLYYNPEFVGRLNHEECKFLIAHEVMHCVYEHMLRRNGREPRLWNCAADYVINWELKEIGVGTIIPPEKLVDPEVLKKNPNYIRDNKVGALIDRRFAGMSSEEVFKILDDEKQEQGDSMDQHIEVVFGQPGEGDPSGKNGPIPMTKDEIERLPDDIRKAVMDAAKIAEEMGGAGNLPGGVRRLLEKWNDSQMDWREVLNCIIQSLFKSDYTWQRPSRKSFQSGCYLPGMKNDERVSVDVAIDTSGSMTAKMLADFLGEVRGIMEQFQDFKLRVWCFDTSTYTIHTYEADNLEDIDDFEMEGGGGTMFECNWEMMRENEIMPDQLLVFTDGYPCGSWGEEDYCDTAFVVHGKKDIIAPFGETVYYEREEA